MGLEGTAEVRFRLVDVDCTSASCTLVLARHLTKAPGIVDFHVNPMDSILAVRYDPRRTSPAEITGVVRATGFRAIGPIMPRRGQEGTGGPRSPPDGTP